MIAIVRHSSISIPLDIAPPVPADRLGAVSPSAPSHQFTVSL